MLINSQVNMMCPGGQEGQWHPGVCQQYCSQGHQGSDLLIPLYSEAFPHLYGTGEPAPQVLCPVFGPSLPEMHQGAGVCSEKGNRAGEVSGAQIP